MQYNTNNIIPTFSSYYYLHGDDIQTFIPYKLYDSSLLWVSNIHDVKTKPIPTLNIKSIQSDYTKQKVSPKIAIKESPTKSSPTTKSKPSPREIRDNVESISAAKDYFNSPETSFVYPEDQNKNIYIKQSRNLGLLLSESSSESEIVINKKPNESNTYEELDIYGTKYNVTFNKNDKENNSMYSVSFFNKNSVHITACNKRSYDLVVKDSYKSKFIYYNPLNDAIQLRNSTISIPGYIQYIVYIKDYEWNNLMIDTMNPIYVKCDIPCNVTDFITVYEKMFEYILINKSEEES